MYTHICIHIATLTVHRSDVDVSRQCMNQQHIYIYTRTHTHKNTYTKKCLNIKICDREIHWILAIYITQFILLFQIKLIIKITHTHTQYTKIKFFINL